MLLYISLLRHNLLCPRPFFYLNLQSVLDLFWPFIGHPGYSSEAVSVSVAGASLVSFRSWDSALRSMWILLLDFEVVAWCLRLTLQCHLLDSEVVAWCLRLVLQWSRRHPSSRSLVVMTLTRPPGCCLEEVAVPPWRSSNSSSTTSFSSSPSTTPATGLSIPHLLLQ